MGARSGLRPVEAPYHLRRLRQSRHQHAGASEGAGAMSWVAPCLWTALGLLVTLALWPGTWVLVANMMR